MSYWSRFVDVVYSMEISYDLIRCILAQYGAFAIFISFTQVFSAGITSDDLAQITGERKLEKHQFPHPVGAMVSGVVVSKASKSSSKYVLTICRHYDATSTSFPSTIVD